MSLQLNQSRPKFTLSSIQQKQCMKAVDCCDSTFDRTGLVDPTQVLELHYLSSLSSALGLARPQILGKGQDHIHPPPPAHHFDCRFVRLSVANGLDLRFSKFHSDFSFALVAKKSVVITVFATVIVFYFAPLTDFLILILWEQFLLSCSDLKTKQTIKQPAHQ